MTPGQENDQPSQDKLLQEADAALTPELVEHIISAVGSHVANSLQGCGRERDLPFPKGLITLAYLKAIRDWPEGARLDAVCSIYVTLDDYTLADEEYDVLCRWLRFLRESGQTSVEQTGQEIAQKAKEAGIRQAVEIQEALRSKCYKRCESMDMVKGLRKNR